MKKNFFDKKDYNKRILESENFIVLPSLGSLVPGWLLVVPKAFYINLSQLPSYLLEELESLVKEIEEKILPKFGNNYVLFEHGPKFENSLAGCGVDYSHLHFVPISFDLKKGLSSYLGFDYQWSEITSLADLGNLEDFSKDYLYLKDQSGIHSVSFQDSIPSQTFRKVIANYLGTPEYFDWKTNHGIENIKLTIEKAILQEV